MQSRHATALVGLLASLAVSVAIYYYTGWVLFFLLVPFVPLLFRGRDEEREPLPRRTCPECGYATSDPEVRYCPRDGTELD
ncbi:hypothetical protein EFA46_000270 [Halarchaeum sp. CBA1220]|uniref:hypothetical protein n=1 Tax=Halarchaeum sp. CBA1220 TaxID=1853682 RepID=UPI000F3A818A|nr:hypothetical protein [Halarchaeum sp. CBA1220]QLC32707.1 hypothetical protein EFA46_000270 [Halarchaeum sp. CBA1220]